MRSTLWGAWLLAACSSSNAYQPPPHPVGPNPQPIAQQPNELPAHHFYARESRGQQYPGAMAVSYTALPPMVRSNRCVAAGAVPEGRPTPMPKPKPKRAKAKTAKANPDPGFVPYNGGGQAAAPAEESEAQLADSRNAAPPATSPGLASGGDAADDGDNELASGAPADILDNVDVASRDKSAERSQRRHARQSRREAKRSHKRALATASPAAPAAEAPMAFDEPYLVEPEPMPLAWPPTEEGWGAATFLSNDDTMSLSSAQRVAFAIDQHLPLPSQHIRPHELLNYFSFAQAEPQPGQDFAVGAQLAASRRDPGMLTLGVSVAARPIGRQGRRNAALTFVIDRSGSMKAEGRMEYLKRGLLRMARELKDGDIVNVVTFDHRVCSPLRNFVVGRDSLSDLTETIHRIKPSGSTNLHAGLTQGYQLADASYQAKYSNRLLIISDALANTGVTDPRTLSMVADWYDARRIRLSGIGVGREFNDALLDSLTEKGRGAYVFLGSEAEVDAVFGARFTSLIETVANDVHFRLHLPPSLRIQAFHGEESSTVKADVQAVHFFADTSQLLLADLEPWQGQLRPQDDIMLEVEYQHPETGQVMVEDHVFNLAEVTEANDNVRKGELIMHFVEALQRQARRGPPSGWQPRPGTWEDLAAAEDCSQTRQELRDLAAGSRDSEVARVLSLWDGYCTRFTGGVTGRPPRKSATEDRWPSAGR
ncbi:MAG: VWA domain-containing protein [Deltaproteobacteria bacterium]|nr:VWA domain-containing protein [Deltaproteobacteria bacterium]